MASLVLTVTAFALAAQTTATAPRKAPATGRWIVKKSVSKMDDSATVTLLLQANSAVMGWPRTTAVPTLILRCKEGEIDAYVNVGLRPAVEYANTEGATVQVRFDKTPAIELNTTQSTDGEALFFGDPKTVIETLLAHRFMLFRFTPFNSNPQETTFTLVGLGAAVKPLQAACEWDPDKERKAAEVAEQRTIEDLAARMVDTAVPEDARAMAAQDLGEMDTPGLRLAVPALMKALQDPFYAVRFNAVRALAKIGPPAAEAIPALEAVAKTDPRRFVADEATEALLKIRP